MTQPSLPVRQRAIIDSTLRCSTGTRLPNFARYAAPYRRSTSATVGMAGSDSVPGHQLVDDRQRLLFAMRREIEVQHRRVQRIVPEVLLDHPRVGAPFQQMRGIGMPESMKRDATLFPAKSL